MDGSLGHWVGWWVGGQVPKIRAATYWCVLVRANPVYSEVQHVHCYTDMYIRASIMHTLYCHVRYHKMPCLAISSKELSDHVHHERAFVSLSPEPLSLVTC